MRSWRRGTKEMDLILGNFANDVLAELDPGALDAHESLIAEGDNQLYDWISGRTPAPSEHIPAIERVLAYLSARSF
ncbi:MAG: succinate dehydrogenase assembly factor 2 [Pseudomonadota bacterium]